MPTRKYTRPDGATGTHVIALGITCWDDGTYTGTVTAWEPGGERMRHYRVGPGPCMSGVAPQGVEALQQAAQDVLEQWQAGTLR